MRIVCSDLSRAWVCVIAIITSGCLADEPASTGSVTVNLAGETVTGVSYRLRNATVAVTGTGTFQLFNTEDDPSRTQLSASVAPGNYTAHLSPGFRLERVDGDGATAVSAALISPNPVAFSVLANQRTVVPLRFQVNAEELDMAQGYDVVLDVDEVGAHGLVVTNLGGGGAIEIFGIHANGNAAPRRVITGTLTSLVGPRGVTVFNGEIFVADPSTIAILVYPLRASGNTPPIRRISGTNTRLSGPWGIAVYEGEIYVSQTSGTIQVFPLNATGNVVPTRSINGVAAARHLAIDNDEIFVGDQTRRVVSVIAADASGVAVPRRTIFGAGAVTGLVVDHGELFVADDDGAIRAFTATSSGSTGLLRTFNATFALSGIDQLAVLDGELFVATRFLHSVHVFPAQGAGTIPSQRSIIGDATRISNPSGVAVF